MITTKNERTIAMTMLDFRKLLKLKDNEHFASDSGSYFSKDVEKDRIMKQLTIVEVEEE